MSNNIVAIVGRPNVGKSTLFNRLVGGRKAIVDEASGVTRDRHYGVSEWGGVKFSVVDTGGYIKGSEDQFEGEIRKQVEIAIAEASVILFMTDVYTGITHADEEVANILRRSNKPVFVIANKVDNNERRNESGVFYSFGLGEVYCLFSISGSGTGDLLDEVIKKLDKDAESALSDSPRFAIIGKPNVGKSSFLNALLDTDRNIVTPIAGTTRDTIDTVYNKYGFNLVLIDTAGVRKKAKVHEDLEFYSVMRSVKAIENSDVCLLIIDAVEGFNDQDISLFSLSEKKHKGIVILVNKWDLVEKDNHTTKQFEALIKQRTAPFKDIPVVFISALNKQRIHKALEIAMDVYNNRNKKISTSKLNDILLPIIEETPPPATKGKYIKIKFITQLPTHAPSFAFFCNLPQYVKEPYRRFLENKLRENFGFTGVPVRIFMRKK
jgi:GTPase